MKLYYILIITLLLLTGCLSNNTNIIPPAPDRPIVCTEEAKVCPDGSAVGRTGPNCEFAPCPTLPEEQIQNSSIVFPTSEFKERITKKPFGIFITPETSPVQPERFRGFHTGVDVEYTNTVSTVLVNAIANGTIMFSDWVSGYGGTVVIKHLIDNQNYTVVYGHLEPSVLVKKNSLVKAGEQIGALGEGGTNETDNERKHLHLAVTKGTSVNLKGYVQTKEELNSWIDPLTLFP